MVLTLGFIAKTLALFKHTLDLNCSSATVCEKVMGRYAGLCLLMVFSNLFKSDCVCVHACVCLCLCDVTHDVLKAHSFPACLSLKSDSIQTLKKDKLLLLRLFSGSHSATGLSNKARVNTSFSLLQWVYPGCSGFLPH